MPEDKTPRNNKTRRLAEKIKDQPKKTTTVIMGYEQEVVDVYREAYDSILGKLQKGFQNRNWYMVKRQTILLKAVSTTIDRLEGNLGEIYQRALNDITQLATEEGIKDLEGLYNKLDNKYRDFVRINKDFTKIMFDDVMSKVAERTLNMKAQTKTLLRRAAQQVFRRASVEGLSRADTAKLLGKEVLNRIPGFEFVDRAGRRWDNSRYFEMLTRTTLSNALHQEYTNTLTEEGHDLVKVSSNGATDSCKKWEGRILSITGATRGYPTYAQAQATGEIFHPNCTHRVFAYHPDLERYFEG